MTWAPCPHGVRTREKKKSHLFHPSTEEILLGGGVSACGLWLVLFLFVVGLSLSFSSPSDCISLPSMMTWAPCPHGVRTRGKTISHRAYLQLDQLWNSVSTVLDVALNRLPVKAAAKAE